MQETIPVIILYVFLQLFFTLNDTEKRLVEAKTNFPASHSDGVEYAVR